MKAGELFSFILIFIYTLFTYLLFVKSTETKQKIKFLPRKESIQTNNFLYFWFVCFNRMGAGSFWEREKSKYRTFKHSRH